MCSYICTKIHLHAEETIKVFFLFALNLLRNDFRNDIIAPVT